MDQTVLPTLESIERTLPSHLDAITSAAASGEWDAKASGSRDKFSRWNP